MDNIKADILLCNHFDLTWRRCFKMKFEYDNKLWASYAEIQEYYITQCIEYCMSNNEFKFNIEYVAILRNYIRNNPDKLSLLQKLYKEGKMDVPFAGDNIIDTNLVTGESIIRNYQMGAEYIKDYFGDFSMCCYRRDGFGNSAQLPQIIRGFGLNWIWGLSYTEPNGELWRGLDGSVVYCKDPDFLGEFGSIDKYRPCDLCNGFGEVEGNVCDICDGKGIHWRDPKYDLQLDIKDPITISYGVVGQRSEEIIPPIGMLDWPNQLKEHYGIDGSFATFKDVYAKLKDKIDFIVDKQEGTFISGCELNPNNTGVYVTRINTKKHIRELEYALFSTESLLAMAAIKGMEYPDKELEGIWEKLLFTMFHDAITGTYVDPSDQELCMIRQEVEQEIDILRSKALASIGIEEQDCICLINPSGQARNQLVSINFNRENGVPQLVDTFGTNIPIVSMEKNNDILTIQIMSGNIEGFGCKTIFVSGYIAEGDSPECQERFIENHRFRINADEKGITEIYDKKLGRNLFLKGEVRPHEIIIEHDEGSPWATLSADNSRMYLTEKTRLKSVEKYDNMQCMKFKIEPFNTATVEGVGVEWNVILIDGVDRIDFSSTIYWDTYNERLRVAFPTIVKGKHLYEIPYGTIERNEYQPSYGWFGANGDWPALNWAGISSDNIGIGLINKGIPSYKVESGEDGDTILLTLLRSPSVPTYLHEPSSYSMEWYDGMRDVGIHSFEYSIVAYDCSLKKSSIVEDAEGVNMSMIVTNSKVDLPEMPQLVSDNVRISSIKYCRSGALTIRLYEFRGIGGGIELNLPDYINRVYLTDLNEQEISEQPIAENVICMDLKPFQIVTLRLTLN